jgi:WD40 repeat protein
MHQCLFIFRFHCPLQQTRIENNGTWTQATSMGSPRTLFGLVTLENGNVMATGGGTSAAMVDIYEVNSNRWIAASTMSVARVGVGLAALHDGGALAVGGKSSPSTAERYDSTTRRWATVSSMHTARIYSQLATLQNGKVIVTGGRSTAVSVSATVTCEIFDPVAGTWGSIASMHHARDIHAIAVMGNGSVLVAGGFDGSVTLSSAELYDPVANKWTYMQSLFTIRAGLGLVMLNNGTAMVLGGEISPSDVLASSVVLDATGSWRVSSMIMPTRLVYFGATMLKNGSVFIAGGGESAGTPTNITRVWTPSGSPSPSPPPSPGGSFRCVEDKCVEDSSGVPRDECDKFCGSGKYLCVGGRCESSATGASFSECEAICRPESMFSI